MKTVRMEMAFAAAIVIAAASFLAIWRLSSDRASDLVTEDPGEQAAKSPGDSGAEPAQAKPGQAPAAKNAPEKTAALGTIAGRVLDSSGAPIPEAAVTLSAAGESSTPRSCSTGPDGSYSFGGLDTGSAYKARAEKGGYVSSESGEIAFAPGAVRADAADLVLEQACTVEGSVSGEGGGAISGAEIILDLLVEREGILVTSAKPPHSARSGEDGRFSISTLPRGGYRIMAQAEGWARKVEPKVDASPSGPARVDFVLSAQRILAGTVRNSRGEGIRGASIAGYYQGKGGGFATPAAISAGDGSFSIPHLPEGQATLQASADGYLPERKLGVPVPSTGVDFTLMKADGAIEGSISGPSGPLDSFRLRRFKEHPGNLQKTAIGMMEGVSKEFREAGGKFRLEGLGPGKYVIEAYAQGCTGGEKRGIEVREGETTSGVEISLGTGFPLKGKVVRKSDGSAIPGAEIAVNLTIKGPFQEVPFAPSDVKTVTDASGAFMLDMLKEGNVSLSVSHPEFGMACRSGITIIPGEAPEDVTISLSAPGFVAGRVTDASGKGVEGDYIVIQHPTEPTLKQTLQTGPEGRYASKPISPGTYQVIHVKNADHSKVKVKVTPVKSGETAVMDFAESAGCRLHGTVTSGGKPLAGCYVTILPGGDETADRKDIAVASTDENGLYVLQGVPPGKYIVMAQTSLPGSDSSSKTVQVEVDVKADEFSKLVDVAFPSGRVSGLVIEASSGKPVSGALVILSGADQWEKSNDLRSLSEAVKQLIGQGLTDEKGGFEIGGLAAGRFRLWVTRDGYAAEVTDVLEVAAGGAVHVTVSVSPESVVKGVVTLLGSGPVEKAALCLLDKDGKPCDFTFGVCFSDASGRYEMRSIKDGTYVVYAAAPGCGRAVSSPITVPKGGSVECNFALSPEGGIVVTAARGGLAMEGAVVKVFNQLGTEIVDRLNLENIYSSTRERKTDATGTLRVGMLAKGVYRVEVKAPSGETKVLEAAVEAGTDARIPVVFE